jgi:lipoate-protein ligase A
MASHFNVACEEQVWNEQQLAQPVREPRWRLWNYREPAIVLGCSQRGLLAGAHDDSGIELLLRSSGGGAVLAGPWMLGLSVVLPPDHALLGHGPVASYRWLGELLATTLRDARIDALALPPEVMRLAAPAGALSWACFGGLSPWEVVTGGRKIAGLAQVRRRHGVLLVGGVLLDAPDWPLLCAALRQPASDAAALAQRTTSWAEEGGSPAAAPWFTDTLDARLRGLLQAAPPPCSASPELVLEAA